MGLLPDVKLPVAHVPECRECFPRHPLQRKPLVRHTHPKYSSWHASRHVRDARAVMHVGIGNPWWPGKRSWHSRRMRNSQCYISGKRPIVTAMRARHGMSCTVINPIYFLHFLLTYIMLRHVFDGELYLFLAVHFQIFEEMWFVVKFWRCTVKFSMNKWNEIILHPIWTHDMFSKLKS